ncbi:hypothetical protein [uncultured Desulfovibrio sp.]|uniref:hypothetical protein n=1 Tax=uncultured Desulfovibrio sp. TaxID=167968 RepID=UPI002627560F|nr:hypothetical protein [uncultured Desulfovibrio sp.]
MLFEQCFAGQPSVNARDMAASWRPSYGEWLGAQAAEGFDRTITGRYLEEKGIALAEMRAGDYDPDWSLRNNETMSPMERAFVLKGWMPPAPDHAHAMTEADWKASPWYRKEISFRPDMTATRARIMAENFDRRRYRERLLARGNELYDDAGDMALGFGAGLLGSLPDPINLLPLGGGAAAGSGAATLGRTLLRGAKAGAVNGAVSTAVSDALVLPDLASRGEDADFVDLLLDTLAGGVLGGVFGTPIFLTSSLDSGSFVRAARAGDDPAPFASSPDSDFLARAGAEATPFDRTPDGDLMARAGYAEAVPDASGEATAARAGDAAVDAESLPARNADNDLLRQGWTAGERRAVARAADLNLENMDDGRSAEVAALERDYDSIEPLPLPQRPDDAFTSGLEAMRRVIREQTDVKDAMVRQDVGSISFYWGTEGRGPKLKGGSGVSHLIARRNSEGLDGEAIAEKMVEVLAYGKAGEIYGPENGQHVNIVYNGYTAVLSLYRFRNRETWLLTGWKNDPVGEASAVNAPSPTQTNPSGIRDKLGATGSSDSLPLLSAKGKPLFADHIASPDISTATEPPAPSRMTPEAARQAEAGALAGQDESLRQRLADVEKRGAVDAGGPAARTEDGLAGGPGSEARKK